MKVIVGLGNPGKEYEGTRHNIGREVATLIAKKFDFEAFEANSKFAGHMARGHIGKTPVTILLPDTYMNKSGKAFLSLRAKPDDIILIHDDTDIAVGVAKISFGKRSAGHKGVESVMRVLKTRDFWRIRIGAQKKKHVDAMEIVLKKFSPAERLSLKKLEKRILESIEKPLFITTLSG